MTPKQLTYFSRIAECGSFAAAAKELLIAQPALSQQIANLEAELGVTLFFRKPRGVELTESGQQLLTHAYAILRHIESAVLDVQSAAVEPQGAIRVGMAQSVNNVMAVELAAATQARYPHIQNREGLACMAFADLVHYTIMSPEIHDGLGYRIKQYEEETGIALNKKRSYGQLSTDLNVVLGGDAEMILAGSSFYHLRGDPRLVTAKVVEPQLYRDVFLLTSPSQPLTNTRVRMQALIHELAGDIFALGRSDGEVLSGAPA